jgi:nucleotide-binding universal stress UspA family protein
VPQQTGRTKETVIPELVLRSGQPAATLDQIAAEGGYELLVVGARGVALSNVLLGSVATTLVARASGPVLVVGRGGARSAEEPSRPG